MPDPTVTSWNRVTCVSVRAPDPFVETYVLLSSCFLEIRVLTEHGEQVKDVCGGSAYDVTSLDAEI